MRTLELSTATKPLAEYAAQLTSATDGWLLVEQNQPVAVLMPLVGVDQESILLSMNPDFISIIEESRKQFKLGQKSSLEQVKELVSMWEEEEVMREG